MREVIAIGTKFDQQPGEVGNLEEVVLICNGFTDVDIAFGDRAIVWSAQLKTAKAGVTFDDGKDVAFLDMLTKAFTYRFSDAWVA